MIDRLLKDFDEEDMCVLSTLLNRLEQYFADFPELTPEDIIDA